MDWGNLHAAGVHLGQTLAIYGAGFSVGRHVVKVMRNNIRASVAFADVMRDTAIAFVGGYLCGGLINAGEQTAGGHAIASAVSAATSAIPSSSVGHLLSNLTKSAFEAINSACAPLGRTLTAATMGTAISGAVAISVSNVAFIAEFVEAILASAAPILLISAFVGGIFALIFDK